MVSSRYNARSVAPGVHLDSDTVELLGNESVVQQVWLAFEAAAWMSIGIGEASPDAIGAATTPPASSEDEAEHSYVLLLFV